MVEVIGTLFILSYGETVISLNALNYFWSNLDEKR